MEYLLQKEEVEVKLVLVCYFLPPTPATGLLLPSFPLIPYLHLSVVP